MKLTSIETWKGLPALLAIFALALTAAACLDILSPSAVTQNGDANAKVEKGQPAATATPTPKATPAPATSPTFALCRATAIEAAISGGTQPNEILVTDDPKKLDATARNSQGNVPDGCNLSRFPDWKSLTPTVCAVLGGGWNPLLDGLKVGSCEVRTCLRQAGDGPCFPEPGSVLLPGESNPVTSPVFQVSVK